MEDLTDCGGTESDVAVLKDFADLVDRMVSFSQLDDSVPGGGLAGSGRGTTARRGEKGGIRIPAEMMAKDSEGFRRVTELGGYHVGGFVFDEIGSQCLILPLPGVRRFEEEPPALC